MILDNIRQNNVCDILNLPVSDQEIRESVYSLKSDKSPGPDRICAEIYRSAQEKSSFFAFPPRTKILRRELSRRKLCEISRKFAPTICFFARFRRETPRDFAQLLRENSESFKKKKVNSVYIYIYIYIYIHC